MAKSRADPSAAVTRKSAPSGRACVKSKKFASSRTNAGKFVSVIPAGK
jgi:hypothetical protein